MNMKFNDVCHMITDVTMGMLRNLAVFKMLNHIFYLFAECGTTRIF